MDFIKNIVKALFRIFKESQQLTLTSESTPFTNPKTKDYTIPERYNAFPRYNGTFRWEPQEVETEKYYRIKLHYKGQLDQTFISTLLQNGFIQGSNVRYDKDNTYVIVEADNLDTTIVYHVKK